MFLAIVIPTYLYIVDTINIGELISFLGLSIIFYTLSFSPVSFSNGISINIKDQKLIYIGSSGIIILLIGQII